MANKQKIILMDKDFVAGIIKTLKSLDVRGYESNKKLVTVTLELERAFNTTLPLTIEPNGVPEQGDTERSIEDMKRSKNK